MKKLILAMIFMLISLTSAVADFTLDDLFISGGTDKPVKSKVRDKHDC